MQKALITGASGGIGRELAILMAVAGHDLVLVARSKDELQKVQSLLEKKSDSKVSIYPIDLSKTGAAKKLYDHYKNSGIEILINNAGVGLKGDFFNDDPAKTVAIAQLNMISLMELSQLFGRDFIKNDKGKILNIASIAAFLPGPKQPVYYATKSFVRELSRALSYNVRNTNVTVTVLHPGVTKTNFFVSSNAASVKGGASPISVARTGYRAMMNGKTEVTHGLANKFLTNILIRLVPSRYQAMLVDRGSEV
ncbi:MAG: uncharacterized protein QG628_241 [Patescibacteria group bacterium]|nr:uncharacterized protein [Patescibacteria group bacterium]